jgi:hypothetical protein
MREGIKGCALSREQIVDAMRQLALVEGLGGGRGSTITTANLDAWVSETKPNQVPLGLLPLFCRVTGSVEPIGALLAPLGGAAVNARELQLLEWAQVELETRRLSRHRRKLLQEIDHE